MKHRTEYLKRSKEHVSVYFCIFMLFLTSMEIWIAWDGRGRFINFFLWVSLLFLIKKNRIKLNYEQKNVAIFFTLFISYTCLYLVNMNVNGIIGSLFSYFLPASLIIFLNDNDRIKCLRYIVKWFAMLMVPAIITYILCQTIGLPSLGTLKLHDSPYQADWYLYKENYLFCTMYAFKETERFNGPFNEPGHLGMMSAFLLFADGYRFKKRNTWIIFLALLMTLSLSGYVLAFMGFLLRKYNEGKVKMKWLIPFIIIIVGGYLYGTYYNGGDNIINERIMARLEYDEESGIVGNNRARGDIHIYFLKMLYDPYLLLFGYDRDTVVQWAFEGSRGTGIEVFIVHHGIVGVLLSISLYFVCSLYSKPKRTAILFLIYMILILLQRSYWYWFSMLICYLYGLTSWTKTLKR